MKTRNRALILGGTALALLLGGCRGFTSPEPPILLQRNMFNTPRYNAYDGNDFFEDGRNMRPIPAGTVPRGSAFLLPQDPYRQGMVDSQYVNTNPHPLTMAFLERGRERYDIYCSVCHGQTGVGGGIVVRRGFVPPPSLNDQRLRDVEDGYLYQVIAEGVRNMPAYGHQIPIADRWAIVSYVRALQISQGVPVAEVPEQHRAALQ